MLGRAYKSHVSHDNAGSGLAPRLADSLRRPFALSPFRPFAHTPTRRHPHTPIRLLLLAALTTTAPPPPPHAHPPSPPRRPHHPRPAHQLRFARLTGRPCGSEWSRTRIDRSGCDYRPARWTHRLRAFRRFAALRSFWASPTRDCPVLGYLVRRADLYFSSSAGSKMEQR